MVLLRRLRAEPDGTPASVLLGACEQAALGTALRLRAEAAAAGVRVTLEVIAAGPPEREDEVLAHALACGADAAFRVWDPVLEHADYYAVARVLAAAVRVRRFTWVLCGDRSGDEALGATGPAVAEFLGVPHLSGARDVRAEDPRAAVVARRRSDGLVRDLRLGSPAVLCIADGPPASVPPRRAGSRRRAHQPRHLDLGALGVTAEELRHRCRPEGTLESQVRQAEILPTAEALLERLRAEGLI